MRGIRYLWFLLVLFLATLITALLAIIAGFADRRQRWGRHLVPLWCRVLLAAGGVRVRVIGYWEEVDRAAIFVANHQSYLDIPVLGALLPPGTLWLAKRELFSIPIFGQAMRAIGQIPVDRHNRDAARQSVATAAQRVADGRSVVLFPEGTRSRDGRLQPFKLGFVHLAADSAAPVVPLVIHGTARLWPRGAWGARSGEVIVTILPSCVVPSDLEGEAKRLAADSLYRRMRDVAEGSPC